jgi:hypothetical protein
LSEHPYIQVIYEVKEIPVTYGMDIVYRYVEIVRNRRPSLKYESGNYQTDISSARIDGAILNNLQEDKSVAAYEKLAAVKPEKRHKLIISGEVTPP